jgi:hypothetical protein
MIRVFGFHFRGARAAGIIVVALVLLALVWPALIERSIRQQPGVVHKTVFEHCRYRIGQSILELSSDVFVARMAGCDAFQVRMIHATGGLIRPVMLRVTLDPSPEFPLVERELVFRSIYSNFSFGDSLHGLATGRWAFNPFNVYSARTFTLTF